MRFVCDSTMGKLARLCEWPDLTRVRQGKQHGASSGDFQRGRQVGRLAEFEIPGLQMASNFHHLQVDDPLEQFRKLVSDLQMPLDEKRFLTRCLQCNEPLEKIATEKVLKRLYDFVARTQPEIFVCARCDKLYWHATMPAP